MVCSSRTTIGPPPHYEPGYMIYDACVSPRSTEQPGSSYADPRESSGGYCFDALLNMLCYVMHYSGPLLYILL